MRKTKYFMSGGLAFTEEKDMEKLSKYAREGWILERFAPLGYTLKWDEPQRLVYSLDYRRDPDEEYFALFKEANWTHVCSDADEFHVFSAPEGTKPIYSDNESLIDKYEHEKRNMGKYSLPLLIATVVFFLLRIISMYGWIPSIVGSISLYVGLLCLIILIFPGAPYIAYRYRLNRLRKL